MRVAVIGLGGIATKAYLPLLASWPGLELLVYSRRPETVAAVREQYRLSLGTSDWAELLSWRPQAAIVLSPSETHFDVVSRLLAAGVDVLVEKPATRRSEDTRALAEQARDAKRVLMVAFNRRYAPLHVAARELWNARRVGLAVFAKHRESAAHSDLLENYIDDTIHIIDLLRFYCGEVRAVRTESQVREGRLVGAVSLLALEGGGQAVVATNLEAGAWREEYELHGEGATLTVDAFTALRFVSGGEERAQRESAGSWRATLETRGFGPQIRHFLSCVADRREPLTSAWDCLRTQQVLEELVAAR